MTYWERAALCFGVTCALDMLWAVYIQAAAEKRAFKAALFSAAIVLFGGIVTVNIVADQSMIGFTALGGFVGTFAILRRTRS